jgi:hypothetical protein
VNTGTKSGRDKGREGAAATRGNPALVLLGLLIAAEGLLMAGVFVWSLLQLLTGRPASLASAVAITILAALAAVWVLVIAIQTFRARPWIRAAAITWQLLQIAVAVGCFQGIYAEPGLGWALLIPSLVVIGLVLSPPVTRATRRESPSAREDEDA